jgi:hypothetical protein
MNKILLVCLLLISSQVKSQTFDGIYIGGNAATCLEKFRNKGFKIIENNKVNLSYKLIGKKDGVLFECYLFKTKNGKIRSICCYLPVKYNYESLLSQFDEYKESLTTKYGQPLTGVYRSEDYQAVKNNTLTLYTLFNGGKNSTIVLSVYAMAQVCISVSNNSNQEEYYNEKTEAIQNTF